MVIKFGMRVKEIDKNYELNNNCNLDNGVFNKFAQAAEKQAHEGNKNPLRQSRQFNRTRDSNVLNSVEELEKIKQQEEILKYFDQEFVIDEQVVVSVSRYGYPIGYVQQCLEDNEANHCTTTYYLLANEGPMIE